MHEAEYAHRDIALRNVLMKHADPLLADLGLARSLAKGPVGRDTGAAPVRWSAPVCPLRRLSSSLFRRP
jgi:hypothetical protein